jgi:hypothetical protein
VGKGVLLDSGVAAAADRLEVLEDVEATQSPRNLVVGD